MSVAFLHFTKLFQTLDYRRHGDALSQIHNETINSKYFIFVWKYFRVHLKILFENPKYLLHLRRQYTQRQNLQ
jgi:hypothetical protein